MSKCGLCEGTHYGSVGCPYQCDVCRVNVEPCDKPGCPRNARANFQRDQATMRELQQPAALTSQEIDDFITSNAVPMRFSATAFRRALGEQAKANASSGVTAAITSTLKVCDCDERSEKCALGLERTLLTTSFSRCVLNSGQSKGEQIVVPRTLVNAMVATFECYAQCGMTEKFEDGKKTPNAINCEKYAQQLNALLASPAPAGERPAATTAEGEKCCGNFDTLADAPECKDCPQRQHYLRTSPAPVQQGGTPRLGSERLEATRANSEFWFNAGNKEPDHDRAVLYLANAMFAWRNAAYGLAEELALAAKKP